MLAYVFQRGYYMVVGVEPIEVAILHFMPSLAPYATNVRGLRWSYTTGAPHLEYR